MQIIWDRAMLIARTRGAYGCAFPLPGTTFPPPTPGTMLHDMAFVASCTDDEYNALLEAVRKDMTEWKARVAASGRGNSTLIKSIDISKLEIDI